MKTKLAVLLVGVIATGSLPGGTITGLVNARGAPESGGESGGSSAYQSRRYKFAEKVDYDRLTDFVIYLDGPPANSLPAGKAPAAITTQRNAIFDPHVLVVAAGTTVKSSGNAPTS